MRRQSKGDWEIITIRAGAVEEKSKHFLADEPRAPEKKGRTSERRQKVNDENSARAAARSVNGNFKAGDILLGLDYDAAGMERVEARARAIQGCRPEMEWIDAVWEAADHELKLGIERARRWCKQHGVPLRYLAWTSDTDGKTGEMVRVHHHLIVNREALPAFRAKWQRGRTVGKPLRQEDDYTALVEYLCRQVRRVKDRKLYTPSRNLIKPIVTRRRAVSDAELRVPKGCRLLYRAEHVPGWSSGQYIRYFRPPTKRE